MFFLHYIILSNTIAFGHVLAHSKFSLYPLFHAFMTSRLDSIIPLLTPINYNMSKTQLLLMSHSSFSTFTPSCSNTTSRYCCSLPTKTSITSTPDTWEIFWNTTPHLTTSDCLIISSCPPLPRPNTVPLGNELFPSLWNYLPSNIHNYNSLLSLLHETSTPSPSLLYFFCSLQFLSQNNECCHL